MSETTLEFITLRQPERIRQKVKRLRYIRDLRKDAAAPLRQQLVQANEYGAKALLATAFLNSQLFFTVDRYYEFRYETVVDILREDLIGPFVYRDGALAEGTDIAALIAKLEDRVPVLASSQFFHDPTPPQGAVAALFLQYALIWDSLYAVVVMAGIHRVETNYIIDAIRALHLLSVLRLENLKTTPEVHWPYYDFDAYEAMLAPEIVKYDSLI
jgi:hypothetical protein